MIPMKVCAACCDSAAPEMATAMAITSHCAPRRRQSRLSRTPVPDELVPDSANGLNVPGARRIVPELLPQLADVDVDRPVDHDGLIEGVDMGQQLVPREDPAGKLHQRLEEFELDRGQPDLPAVGGDLVPLEVHHQIAV